MSKTFNLLSIGVPLDSTTSFAELTVDADARYVKITDLPTVVPANETDPLSLHTNGDNTTGLTIDLETTGEITGEMAKVSATAPDEVVGNLWLDPSAGSGGSGGGVTDHSDLNELDYASSGHTGFEPAITAGTTSQVFLGDKSLAAITAVGGMTLVDTATLSEASSFTISGLSTGVRYRLILNITSVTTTGAPRLTFNSDGGANYTRAYWFHSGATFTAGADTGQTFLQLGVYTIKVGENGLYECIFGTSASSTSKVVFDGQSIAFGNTPGGQTLSKLGGLYTGANPLSSLTVTISAGTMTGVAKLYRLA